LVRSLRRTDRIAGRPKASHPARCSNLCDQSPKERSRVVGMAGCHRGAYAGRDAGRPDDVRADWHYESLEPWPR
jgi:hypothetical protein